MCGGTQSLMEAISLPLYSMYRIPTTYSVYQGLGTNNSFISKSAHSIDTFVYK